MSTQSAQTIAEKWSRNLGNAIPTIREGVMAVTKSPMEAAASKATQYADGVRKSVESGKWQAALRSVSLEQWKKQTAEIGTARITDGVRAAKPKMEAFLQQLLPYTERVKQTIAAMPSGTLEDSKQRMLKAMEMMSQFQFRKTG